MDWDLAIKRNSEVLAGIVETLFAMLGLVGEATVARLPWPTYRAVLRVLRPAESALRRLIVVAARGLVVAPAMSRPRRAGGIKKGKAGPHVPPSNSSIRGPASCSRAGELPSGPARASTCSTPTTNW